MVYKPILLSFEIFSSSQLLGNRRHSSQDNVSINIEKNLQCETLVSGQAEVAETIDQLPLPPPPPQFAPVHSVIC